MKKVGTYTKATIQNDFIYNQNDLFLNEKDEVVKGAKGFVGEIETRKKQMEFLASLEQCDGEFSGSVKVWNKFVSFFNTKNIEIEIDSFRNPFEYDKTYINVEFNFIN